MNQDIFPPRARTLYPDYFVHDHPCFKEKGDTPYYIFSSIG
jgi:hypothetical protein